ncbi:MAG: RNA polymerase sigma factor SigZ [Candidatus Latescibacterota bacterium]
MNPIETLWRNTSDQLLAFIRSRISDPTQAEDILQDIFLKMYEHVHTLRDNQKLESWMYQIARNAIIDHYRTHKPLETLIEEIPNPTSNDQQTRQEMASWLLPIITILPDTYREPIRLSEIEGWSHQKIADHLDLSLSATKSRVRRGKRLIKDALTDCCQFEIDQRGRVVDYERRADTRSFCNC